MNEVNEYYNEIAHKYDYMYEEPYWFLYHEILTRLTRDHTSDKNSKILDLGTGTGKWAIFFSESGNEVTAIDQSMEMLKYAKMKSDLRDLNITYRRMPAEKIDLKEKYFDYVVAYGDVLSYCKDINVVLNEIKKSLKSSGKLLFTVDNSYAFLNDFLSNTEGYNAKKIIDGEKISIGDKSVSKKKFLTKPFFPEEIENILFKNGFKSIDMASLVNFGLYDEEKLARKIDLAADWEYKYCRKRELFACGEHLFISAVLESES